MKAAWREVYGGPGVVTVRDLDKPTPAAGEALVKVKAASVNRADLDGLYPQWQFIRLLLGVRRPREKYRRIGVDVAGTVEAVGEGVTEVKPGDDVYSDISCVNASGAFGEYVAVQAKALEPMPAGLSYEEAAALPHAGCLAINAFRQRRGRSLKAGDRLMVVGASGNVGPFAIQMAKSIGAHVTGVASGEKLEFVRSIGADDVIDYKTTDYKRPAGEAYDWIIDVTAHDSVFRWRKALKPGGVYLTFGGPLRIMFIDAFLGPIYSRLVGRKLGMAIALPFKPEDRTRLRELVAEGVLKPVIDRRFPLDEAADALRHVDDGHARGKVLVIP